MADYTKYFDNCLAVFQGGGCKAIAYIGAYEEAYKRGVVFNEVAGASAGAVIAALIAAKASPSDLKDFVYSIDFKNFAIKTDDKKEDIQSNEGKYRKFWFLKCLRVITCARKISKKILNTNIITLNKKIGGKKKSNLRIKQICCSLLNDYGIYSTQELQKLLNAELCRLLHMEGEEVKFEDLICDLHVVASDTKRNVLIEWNKKRTPKESVAKAVCCSCAIPIYFQPVDKRFVDGGLLSNSPTFIFANKSNYQHILSFRLKQSYQKEEECFVNYTSSLVSTVVDGAVNIQDRQNVSAFDIVIDPGDIKATDFDKLNNKIIDDLIKRGRRKAIKFFKKETRYIKQAQRDQISIKTKEHVYSCVASWNNNNVSEVVISDENTNWYWLLYPTFLKWLNGNARITIFSKHISEYSNKEEREKEVTRRYLLLKFGCKLRPSKNLPIKGFFIHQNQRWLGVAYTLKEDGTFDVGMQYEHLVESPIIEGIVRQFGIEKNVPTCNKYKFQRIADKTIIQKLKSYSIYANANMEMTELPIDSMLAISDCVRLVKYRQIDMIFRMYKESHIPLFDTVQVTTDTTNEDIIMSPIVVEKFDGRFYIIEGKTRVLYALKHGLSRLRVLLISGVKTPLPVANLNQSVPITNLQVTDRKKPLNVEFKENFRHIEKILHLCYADISQEDVNLIYNS